MFNEPRIEEFLEDFGWEESMLTQALLTLQDDDFQKHAGLCEVTGLPGVKELPADQYRLYWHEENSQRAPRFGPGCLKLSIKLAIYTDETGRTAGCVTFHNSR